MVKPEFLQVKTRDGFVMEAILYRPAGASASRKVPVMQFTYGGPYAPRVANRWGGVTNMYYQLLADRGVAVWICDNRSASGKGIQSAWTSYKQLGVQELADIEDGLAYLRKQPWANGTFGLDGWSYGGFMTTYALTHSKSFAMGIGGGNVTDWRLYDSIYTERLMLMPQNNPEGYDKTSVIKAAKDLHGDLLLLHGVIDDNVHLQNTHGLHLRAAEGRQAVPPDALREVAARRRRSAAGQAHAPDDARLHARDAVQAAKPAPSTTDAGQGRR